MSAGPLKNFWGRHVRQVKPVACGMGALAVTSASSSFHLENSAQSVKNEIRELTLDRLIYPLNRTAFAVFGNKGLKKTGRS